MLKFTITLVYLSLSYIFVSAIKLNAKKINVMKTTYYTDRNGAEAIVNGLTDIFGTKEENKEIEKTYSLGFTRYSKLSKRKKLEAFKCLFIEGFGSGIENHNELKLRLEKMTENEFKAFKK